MNAHKAFSEFLSGIAATERGQFTRKLTRDEIMALSHEDHMEYIHWMQANADRLNAERRAMPRKSDPFDIARDYSKPTSRRNYEFGE